MAGPRFSLTAAALSRPRFAIVGAIVACLLGFITLLDYPATEEPTVTLRMATVSAFLPGESPERLEKLLARPIEEALREQGEVKALDTRIRQGSVLIYVTLYDGVPSKEIAGVWQRLRARIAQAAPDLPAGTQGPVLNDDYGRVAVRTLALTGKGYNGSDLLAWSKHLRNQLQGVDGVATITLNGVRPDVTYVELDPDALRRSGTTIADIRSALDARDALNPTGHISEGGLTLPLRGADHLTRPADVAAIPIRQKDGSILSLGALGTVRQMPQDPPQGAAFYNGEPAIVLGISMRGGLNVMSFADRLDARLAEISPTLPAGLAVHTVTNQAEVVEHELKKVGHVFVETVVIVLGVVMLFLGWRSGLVTGAIVPMTVLGTILIMHVFGIELHQISIAAIIIALGIFVDNGIVVVEDYQRRITDGEARLTAARAAGESMMTPLLVSSLAIILTFAPLVAGETDAAEYMRSLGIVLAITLLLSLILALVTTPILAHRFIPAHPDHDEDGGAIGKVKRWYGRLVNRILAKTGMVAAGMAALLAAALIAVQFVPTELFPDSERKQFQMPIELPSNMDPVRGLEIARRISTLLSDSRLFPEFTSNITYMADTGPRFILALNPPAPALNRLYAIVNLKNDADPTASVERARDILAARLPGVDLDPKRFSLGIYEKGVAVFRLRGGDRATLDRAAERLVTALRGVDGMVRIRTSTERPILALTVKIDQARAAAAGLTGADIYRALNAAQNGTVSTMIREGDVAIPVIVRANGTDRQHIARLSALPVGAPGGGITLGSIASIQIDNVTPYLTRRDLLPVVEVTAKHAFLTSQQIVDRVQPAIDRLDLPPGSTLKLGGEIEGGVNTSAGLRNYAPLALIGMFLLFLWQFGSVRKAGIVLASMPFVVIGGTVGLILSGQALGFTAQIGFLALMGIIVNNAVLLLGRIEEDRSAGMPLREAIAHAAEMRLRPIVMTKLTCIAGLIPLYLFGGVLWRPMAAVMMGGLALGTLITLVLIPALYMLAFRRKEDDRPRTLIGEAA